MMKGTRALLAVCGGVFAGAAMYAFAQALHAGQMATGFTVWDAVSRDVVIVAVLVLLALASPGRRGLRLLWMLAGALWIWLLILPPIDTADAGPPGVALLFRFQRWSGIALPLFLVTLAHWSGSYRALRDLREPAALLSAWAAAFSVCARYDWINTDVVSPGVRYGRVAMLCWIFLAAPPLLLVRWVLRRDRRLHPAAIPIERWLLARIAPLVRERWSAAAAGVAVAAPGFIAIGVFQGERGGFAAWMVLACSLLAGPACGAALRRKALGAGEARSSAEPVQA
ncbi:MAG TPA: hypothetical protein VFR37_17045 [Longimicrobium sp.]|nr:hypothetical protein [Longimicrobium sp.]